jgi:hypothetical protein
VGTGNHFFVDAAAGAFVAGLAAVAAALLTRRAAATKVSTLPTQREALQPRERLAA